MENDVARGSNGMVIALSREQQEQYIRPAAPGRFAVGEPSGSAGSSRRKRRDPGEGGAGFRSEEATDDATSVTSANGCGRGCTDHGRSNRRRWQRPGPRAVSIDGDDIGGVVTGPKGPEAGVWVVAETTDLSTRLIKSVVTDDQGRYLLPDLPKANYDVWVRGYGLVDSPKTKATPGRQLALTAVPAPSLRVAASTTPRRYSVVASAGAAGERFPWHGSVGQWHFHEREEPGRMDPQHRQHRRVYRLPSNGQ